MIDTWLDLPTVQMFSVLILFYGITGAAIFWLSFRSPLSKPIRSLTGVVAPFFGAAGILFALMTGFLGADVTERNRQATRSVQAEASAAATLYTLSIAAAPDMATIRVALRDYLQSAIRDEWPNMAETGSANRTETAFAILMSDLSRPQIATEAGQAVHNALMASVLRVRDARAERLALAFDRTSSIKWTTVLLLGLITQISIGLVHLERPRAQLAAIAVFSTAAVVVLGFIALQEHPFEGAIRVTPARLQEVLGQMDG